MAGGYPLYGRGWHRANELAVGGQAAGTRRYWLAYRDGKAVGMAAGNRSNLMDTLLYGRAEGAARALGMGLGEAVQYGVTSGIGEAIVLAPGLGVKDRAEARGLLLDAMIEDAAGAGVVLRGVRPWERELRAALEARGFVAARDRATTYLPLPAGDFGAYRRWLRQRHGTTEKNIGRELSLGRRGGLTIGEIQDWEGEREAIAALYEAHWERWNGPLPLRRDFLTLVKAELGAQAVLRGARVEGELAGVQLLLRAGGVWLALAVAMDEERGKKCAAYFNLGYNSLIAEALEAGRKGIYFGRLLYEAKKRRGCVAVPVDMYVRPRSGWVRLVWVAGFPLRSRMVAREWEGMPEMAERI